MPAIRHPADRDAEKPPPADEVVVIGDGAAAAAISHRLDRDGRPVTSIAGPIDHLLREPGPLGDARTVVVASDSDSRNLLTAQLLRTRFGLDRVIVLANDPDRVPAFLDAGHDPICAASTLGDAIAAGL